MSFISYIYTVTTSLSIRSKIILLSLLFVSQYSFASFYIFPPENVKTGGEVLGTIVDPNNRGVARVLVNLDRADGTTERTVVTQKDGFFSFIGLKPGNYIARVNPEQLQKLRMRANELKFTVRDDISEKIAQAGEIRLAYTSDNKSDVALNLLSDDTSPAVIASAEKSPAVISPAIISSAVASSSAGVVSDSLALLNRINIYNNKNSDDPEGLQRYDSLLRFVVLFDFNSVTVRSEFYGTLKQLGKMLKDNSNIKLEIQGHTDAVGTDKVNMQFSQRRANSVCRILEKYGIAESRLRIVGFGEREPVATNTTSAGRARNRRVVFRVNGERDMVRIENIIRKKPEEITEKEAHIVSQSIQYVDETNPFAVKWKFSYSYLFRHASAEVRPEQRMITKALAGVMKANPCLKVYLTSHADTGSSSDRNMKLSIKRSQAVWDALTLEGIDRTRIEVANFGDNKPFNANSNSAERALNRRVTIAPDKSGCQLNIDSLMTEEILSSYKSKVYGMAIINHDGKYMIQTGLFAQERNAMLMALKLKEFVPDNIYIVPENGLFRVIVGYTETRQQALDVSRIIQASGILSNPENF